LVRRPARQRGRRGRVRRRVPHQRDRDVRTGFGLEAAALTGRRALRAYFSGQNIAVGAIAVPLLTAISFGLAAVAKHPMDGFVATAVGLAGIGAGLALANLFTVASALPDGKARRHPHAQAGQRTRGQAAGACFLTLLGVGLAVTPVILAAVFTRTDPAAIWMPVLVAGRRRVRPRAGLGRRAGRRQHRRAEAAGTYPDRHPERLVGLAVELSGQAGRGDDPVGVLA
jgi:hypothetical protein